MEKSYRRVMTIAGSDPSGGAGVQADIKTISALGCFATSAIVAVVDENTMGVTGIHPVPTPFVVGQIHSILDDIGTDAVKIGMLHSSELIRSVRRTLDEYPSVRDIVLDPVMVATSGDPLLESDAVDTLRDTLLPRARVITPNIPEAELLLGAKITDADQLPDAARDLARLGPSVLLKAGHLAATSAEVTMNELQCGVLMRSPDTEVADSAELLTDYFYNSETGKLTPLIAPRVATRNTHGTGCTLSSALASYLSLGQPLDRAAASAKSYIAAAIAA
ncbi:MAG: bifunctional hydroxymethylpyrimidine kinase/phosphomethylpyrimidine kinase, partial [[Clostridium] fimetarium]|nr:bifunctional hydroxymethylpyrimidine kinase/phosphomethylpyrimidine kinase [[Clostridium] fimetarium]